MPTKPGKKRSTAAAKRSARAGAPMSREARAAYGEIESGVKSLEKAIVEIRRGLLKAERQIESDARSRVQALRKDAQAQLRLLQARQRDAARMLKRLSAAAGESWRDLKSSADSILTDGRAMAASLVERFRRAISG